MKDHLKIKHIDEHARILLTARIVVLYLLTVLGVVYAIVYYQIPLIKHDFFWWPSEFLFLILFLYYVAPLVLATSFGLLFRPFWKSFRNVFFTILAIQLLYSFSISMLRWDYVQKFINQSQWKKSDHINIGKFTSKQFDCNSDGFIDEVGIQAIFDFKKIRPGEYLMHATIVPGASLSPFSIDGGGTFKIAKTGDENLVTQYFSVKARNDLPAAPMQLQNFQVKFLLFRIISIDEFGKKLLQYARWSPFLRDVDWEGNDKKIYGDWVLLDDKIMPDVFLMRAPEILKN